MADYICSSSYFVVSLQIESFILYTYIIISSDSSYDVIPDKRLKGYFCSDIVFNLSGRVLSEYEIKVLEKGLDFVPFQRKVNEPELKETLKSP